MSAPTRFLVTSGCLKPKSEIAEVTPRHREWLDQHYRSGEVRSQLHQCKDIQQFVETQIPAHQRLPNLRENYHLIKAQFCVKCVSDAPLSLPVDVCRIIF